LGLLKTKPVRLLIAIVISAVFAYAANILCKGLMALFWGYDASGIPGNSIRLTILFFVILFFALHFVVGAKTLYEKVYRYRFLIAAIIFAACVAAELHGSSIGVWNAWVQLDAPYANGSTPVFGTPRPERTDEFIVFTPLSFSQAYTGYAAVNPIAQAWPTNMLTIYNQPVLDITLIAKPFYWGYLLFGTAKGLSWFWCGRMIALFLVTFEMFMLLTKEKKIWAVAAAFMITFASVIQWWFSINFFVEMLVFGQLAVLMAWQFFKAESVLKKTVCAVVIGISISAFAFSLYPAWMVPLTYLFAVLFVWAFAKGYAGRRQRLALCAGEPVIAGVAKQTTAVIWIYAAVAILIAAGLVGYWYLGNRDVISVIQNTVYPGQRQSFGGGEGRNLFNYLMNITLPYIQTNNYSGGAVFPGFFPVGEIIAVVCLIKTKAKDKLLIALLAINAFLILYVTAGFPPALAKATLLSYSHAWATAIVCTLISVFILIRAVSGLSETFPGISLKNIPLNRILPVALIVVSLIGGASVNPLMQGISAVTEKPVYSEIQKLQAEDGGIWIGTWPTSNYMIMAGAPTINSTNIIPALGRWEMLDPEGKYMDTYNRYAHVVIGFNKEKTVFGKGGEMIGIEIGLNDLKKLGVKYILVNDSTNEVQDLPVLQWGNGHAEQIYSEFGIRIYKLFYND